MFFFDTSIPDSAIEGGWEHKAIKAAMARGFCLEKDLPSYDFKFAQKANEYISVLNEIEKLVGDFKLWAKKNAILDKGLSQFRFKDLLAPLSHEARSKYVRKFLEEEVCSDQNLEYIGQLFPGLKVSDLAEILVNSLEIRDITNKMIKKSCKNRIQKQFKIHNEAVFGEKAIDKIDQILSNGDITGIGYYPYVLGEQGYGSTRSGHSSSIVARKFNDDTGVCEYLIRNSWGPDCTYYDPELKCEEGQIWVPEERLEKVIFDVTYIE
ncbi:MAG: hypothetical protein ISR65_01565 [Bacteriovoracaceae bacterium]|nr:hypothetical protein [Bacteriovoracaceae bacterium]